MKRNDLCGINEKGNRAGTIVSAKKWCDSGEKEPKR